MSSTDHRHNASYESNGPIPRSPSHTTKRPMLVPAMVSGVGTHKWSEVMATSRGLDQSRLWRQAHPLGYVRRMPGDERGQARSLQYQPKVDETEPSRRSKGAFQGWVVQRPRSYRSVAGDKCFDQ